MRDSSTQIHWTPWVLAVCLLSSLVTVMVKAVTAAPAVQDSICPLPFEPVSLPLTELAGREYFRMDGQATGISGGLYPDGSNQPPAGHLQAGLELSRQIVPLDGDGNPNAQNGRIILLSVGMSNTQTEFGDFIDLTKTDPEINPRLQLFNGALSGQTSDQWVNLQSPAWNFLENNMERYRFSPLQVQAAWVKLTRVEGGEFPGKAQTLQADLQIIVQHLKDKFPNLKIVYLSSRTRSYAIWRGLSPEPAAFETGFAVKWLIEAQINGDPQLNYDPQRGEVRAPYLTWGPYLWIDGQNPRADGLVWSAEDMTGDCTHPSESGSAKVAGMLLDFFRSDPTARGWFLGQAQAPQPTQTNTAVPSLVPPTVAQTQTLAPSPTALPPVEDPATMVPPTLSETPAQAFPRPTGQASIIWPVLTGGGLAILILSALLLARRKPRL